MRCCYSRSHSTALVHIRLLYPGPPAPTLERLAVPIASGLYCFTPSHKISEHPSEMSELVLLTLKRLAVPQAHHVPLHDQLVLGGGEEDRAAADEPVW